MRKDCMFDTGVWLPIDGLAKLSLDCCGRAGWSWPRLCCRWNVGSWLFASMDLGLSVLPRFCSLSTRCNAAPSDAGDCKVGSNGGGVSEWVVEELATADAGDCMMKDLSLEWCWCVGAEKAIPPGYCVGSRGRTVGDSILPSLATFWA